MTSRRDRPAAPNGEIELTPHVMRHAGFFFSTEQSIACFPEPALTQRGAGTGKVRGVLSGERLIVDGSGNRFHSRGSKRRSLPSPSNQACSSVLCAMSELRSANQNSCAPWPPVWRCKTARMF